MDPSITGLELLLGENEPCKGSAELLLLLPVCPPTPSCAEFYSLVRKKVKASILRSLWVVVNLFFTPEIWHKKEVLIAPSYAPDSSPFTVGPPYPRVFSSGIPGTKKM